MARQNLHPNCCSWMSIAGVVLLALYPIATSAQIAGDGTLGTQVNGAAIAPCTGICTITNGAAMGRNLFHSFRQFSLPNQDVADFQVAPPIQNVIVRVTGVGQPFISDINGTIQTSQPANFFLLNPNGIIFGPNSRLQIGGSFLATTVDAIVFPNGVQFSATNPSEPSSLLTITGDPSGFLASQRQPGDIQITSQFLAVAEGQSLVLLGGNLSLDSSIVGIDGIRGGRVQLGSVAGAGIVQLTVVPTLDSNLLSLNFPNQLARADINIGNGSTVGAQAESGGSISLYARNINILGGSKLLAGIGGGLGAVGNQAGDITLDATGAITVSGFQGNQNSKIFNAVSDSTSVGNAGNILITARSLSVTNGGEINTSTFGQGNAGNIVITAPNVLLDARFQGFGILSNVDTKAQGLGGNISINADTLSLTNGSTLNVATTGQGNAGSIFIDTRSLSVTGGAKISASTTNGFNAGNVVITARDSVRVDGFGIDSTRRVVQVDSSGNPLISQIISGVDGDRGQGGDIRITTGALFVTNGAELTANTFGQGNAGNIIVNVRDFISLSGRLNQDSFNQAGGLFARTYSDGRGGNITLQPLAGGQILPIQFQDGAQISSRSEGAGLGGSILITAPQTVTLAGNGIVSAGTLGDGRGGNIQLATQQLTIQNGIDLSTSTFATGKAGDIDITAETFTLRGATVSADTFASGTGGNITVNTPELLVQDDARISASTSGTGVGGNITLQVRDSLTLRGTSSGVFATTALGSTGSGGNIAIDPRVILIQDGATIAVNSQGSGNGGNITIQAGQLELRDHSSISAETASAQGGNITLDINDLLLLRRHGLISATAGTAQDFGNGGNIRIKAPFIIGVSGENSDIIANAFKGNGGNITINTNAIYGLQYRLQLTQFSDISASSQFGINGTVAISTLDVDPSRGLVALPANLTDPSQQISQGCTPGGKTAASSFVATGRGGLPFNPGDPLQNQTVLAKWVSLSEEGKGNTETQERGDRLRGERDSIERVMKSNRAVESVGERINKYPSTHPPLIEAHGLIVTADGTIELVADATVSDRSNIWVTPATCQTLQEKWLSFP